MGVVVDGNEEIIIIEDVDVLEKRRSCQEAGRQLMTNLGPFSAVLSSVSFRFDEFRIEVRSKDIASVHVWAFLLYTSTT